MSVIISEWITAFREGSVLSISGNERVSWKYLLIRNWFFAIQIKKEKELQVHASRYGRGWVRCTNLVIPFSVELTYFALENRTPFRKGHVNIDEEQEPIKYYAYLIEPMFWRCQDKRMTNMMIHLGNAHVSRFALVTGILSLYKSDSCWSLTIFWLARNHSRVLGFRRHSDEVNQQYIRTLCHVKACSM